MPTMLRVEGFRFFFYANEGDPREPPHVHVRRAGSEAKFWLGPKVGLAKSVGFDARTLRRLADIVADNKALFEREWHGYFG